MKKRSMLLLQILVALVALASIFLLARFPMLEGRAQNLGVADIYSDPFLIYGYIISIAFFFSLYKLFRLLGYIRQHHWKSAKSEGALASIKYGAMAMAASVVLAGIYIKIFHHEDDDPAGFLALCVFFAIVFAACALAAGMLEKKLTKAVERKEARN